MYPYVKTVSFIFLEVMITNIQTAGLAFYSNCFKKQSITHMICLFYIFLFFIGVDLYLLNIKPIPRQYFETT